LKLADAVAELNPADDLRQALLTAIAMKLKKLAIAAFWLPYAFLRSCNGRRSIPAK
jgi:hypothetical protein